MMMKRGERRSRREVVVGGGRYVFGLFFILVEDMYLFWVKIRQIFGALPYTNTTSQKCGQRAASNRLHL
jgi:hypothetical protein